MATIAPPVPAPEPQASLSPIARIFGVFFSPKATFEDIVRKPSWVAPFIVLFITGFMLNIALVSHANWVEVMKEQIARNKMASRQLDNLDPDKKEAAYERAASQSKIVRYVRGVIGWPIALLFSSLLYFALYRLIGGARVTYGLTFAIVTFGSLPMALREVLGAVVSIFKDPTAIDPENYLASNPAALLPSDTPAWQLVPLAFLDIFAIWALILVAIGFTAADPKKVPLGKSLGLAIGLHFGLMLFFTMVAWVFS
jgi:hypothetical protein